MFLFSSFTITITQATISSCLGDYKHLQAYVQASATFLSESACLKHSNLNNPVKGLPHHIISLPKILQGLLISLKLKGSIFL